MRITQANLEFIKNDVYLNMTALVPKNNYNSWYLRKNSDSSLMLNNNILDFTFCSDQSSIVDKLAVKAKTIRQKVAMNDWFNGLKLSIAGDANVLRLHKVCLMHKPIGFDDFDFSIVDLRNKTLHIVANYKGGQKPHVFQLNWMDM